MQSADVAADATTTQMLLEELAFADQCGTEIDGGGTVKHILT